MSQNVLNYPRKPLSDTEKTIREATIRVLSALGSTLGSAIVSTCKSTADQTTTSSSLANITNLKFTVSNGIYYHFRFLVAFRSGVLTGGPVFSVNCPAVTNLAATCTILFAADGAASHWVGAITAADDPVTATDVPAISTTYLAVIEGALLPSADGTLQARFASEDNASTITAKKGSMGVLTVLS